MHWRSSVATNATTSRRSTLLLPTPIPMHRTDGEVPLAVATAVTDRLLMVNILACESLFTMSLYHLGTGRIAFRTLGDLGRLTMEAAVLLSVIPWLSHRPHPPSATDRAANSPLPRRPAC